MRLVVNLPDPLWAEFSAFLENRKITFEEYVCLRIQQAINESHVVEGLDLSTPFPFGKFRGTACSVVIRTDPKYIGWCLANIDSFKLKPDAQTLYDNLFVKPEAPVEAAAGIKIRKPRRTRAARKEIAA